MDNLVNLANVTNQMDGLFDVPPLWLDLLLSVCGMVLGLLVAILGSRVVKFATFLLAFAMGMTLTALVFMKLTNDQTTALIAGAVGGALLGVLALCVAKVGKAVVGGGVAVLIVILFVQTGLASKIGNNYVVWVALGVLLLLCVFLAWKYHAHLFVVVTAFGGAFAFTIGVSHFIDAKMSITRFFSDPGSVLCTNDTCLLLILLWIGLGLVAVFVQWQMNKKKREKDSGEEEEGRTQQSSFRQRLEDRRMERLTLIGVDADSILDAESIEIVDMSETKTSFADRVRQSKQQKQQSELQSKQEGRKKRRSEKSSGRSSERRG
jgi:hypothetical protein